MSWYDYEKSKALALKPFYALIMAAMRQADVENADKLKRMFPDVWEELWERHNAPDGLIGGEGTYNHPSESGC